MNSIYDCYTLSNGVRIPCVGYGTYKAADGNGSAVIRMALEAGYRYFDTFVREQMPGYALNWEQMPAKKLPQSFPLK